MIGPWDPLRMSRSSSGPTEILENSFRTDRFIKFNIRTEWLFPGRSQSQSYRTGIIYCRTFTVPRIIKFPPEFATSTTDYPINRIETSYNNNELCTVIELLTGNCLEKYYYIVSFSARNVVNYMSPTNCIPSMVFGVRPCWVLPEQEE